MSENFAPLFLLHVSSTESRDIHSFLVDAETGKLELIESTKVPGSGAPTRGNIPLLWGPHQEILYAHVRNEPFPLSAFALDKNSNRLRLLETVPMPAPLAYLSMSNDGKYLFGASYDGALVTVNGIKSSGHLITPCQQSLSTPPKAHCILPAPFGDFVYVTSVDGDVILVYELDEATGRLNEIKGLRTPTKAGAGPRHLLFHPLLDYLYCINEHDGSLAVYSVDRSSGALLELQRMPLVPANFTGNALASDIHFTPDGLHLYASVRKTNTITAFDVDPTTGILSNTETYLVDANPRGFAIDPSGKLLICAGQETNHIAVYKIQSTTGRLTLLERYPVGKRPSWIEIIYIPNAALINGT